MNIKQVSLFLFWLGYGFHLWNWSLVPSTISETEGILFVASSLMLMLNRRYSIAILVGCVASSLGLLDSVFNHGVFNSFGNFLYFAVESFSAAILFNAAALHFKNKTFLPENIANHIPSLRVKHAITQHTFDKQKDKIFAALNIVSLAFVLSFWILTFIYTIGVVVTVNLADESWIQLFYDQFGYMGNLRIFLALSIINFVLIVTAIMFHKAKRDSRFRVAVCGFYSSVLASFFLSIGEGFDLYRLLVVIYAGVAVYSGLLSHFVNSNENRKTEVAI